ncbi:ATP-binding protein [Streptomyces litchfieldiae]|uniref:NB-ARC domain-containing protein n=1 Tax=Streptomyces litchfieldiae TaxID=3075543 RepID=A0ABU2MKX7_9ACTN|nr:NB-ARC domain-containing protein [Streptomyces sp. DSM 44938]MDT0342260.1 hypothetical protein [Streptomyces sp. DSM 44938]
MGGEEERPGGTHAELSGTSRDVVQAGQVSGGIHFHGPVPGDTPTPRQLPGDVRGFVNRTAELEQLNAVLTDGGGDPVVVSVCVIAGTAGAGKTSLAIRWAHRIEERFPDGQLYVNLRGYDPGEPVTAQEALHRFLTALGVPAPAIPADVDASAALFRSLLAGRRMLIVLDNAASVAQVRPLLPGSAGCLVIVTSRSRLPGLAIRDGAHRLTLGTLPESEAIALLRAVTAGYRPEDDADKLAELARLCARLPLALRIAAERAAGYPHLRLDDLIAELRDESSLWDALSAGDGEDADAVRTVFAWSYRALSDQAARLFRLLGLHPGPEFGLPAAAALAGVGTGKTRQLLNSLVEAHLLQQTMPDRYEFHDLLRAYASDQVQRDEPAEERTAALRRVLDWYVHTADAAQTWMSPIRDHLPLAPPGGWRRTAVVPRLRHGRGLGRARACQSAECHPCRRESRTRRVCVAVGSRPAQRGSPLRVRHGLAARRRERTARRPPARRPRGGGRAAVRARYELHPGQPADRKPGMPPEGAGNPA